MFDLAITAFHIGLPCFLVGLIKQTWNQSKISHYCGEWLVVSRRMELIIVITLEARSKNWMWFILMDQKYARQWNTWTFEGTVVRNVQPTSTSQWAPTSTLIVTRIVISIAPVVPYSLRITLAYTTTLTLHSDVQKVKKVQHKFGLEITSSIAYHTTMNDSCRLLSLLIVHHCVSLKLW